MPSLVIHNKELLDEVLNRGANVNVMSNTGQTPLSFAMVHGTFDTIRRLRSADAKIGEGDLLHRAVDRENRSEGVALINWLTRSGVNVDGIECDDPHAYQLRHPFPRGTALPHACRKDNWEAAKALLRAGADPARPQVRGDFEEPVNPLSLVQSARMRAVFDEHARDGYQAVDVAYDLF